MRWGAKAIRVVKDRRLSCNEAVIVSSSSHYVQINWHMHKKYKISNTYMNTNCETDVSKSGSYVDIQDNIFKPTLHVIAYH